MARLLVVDDEDKIRMMIRKYAEFEGYSVDEAADGFEAVNKALKESYDLIIMDVMMPGLDGFGAVSKIRAKDTHTPVLMLSARGEEYDRTHGFELGADDYVVKPFSVRELMMRVAAILKRTSGSQNSVKRDVETFDGLSVDFTARTVSIDGKALSLSPKEYDLLFYLVRNKGIALTREQLINEVWGYEYDSDDRTLDTHIKLLRRSLGEYSRFIVTLRSVGYRFEPGNK